MPTIPYVTPYVSQFGFRFNFQNAFNTETVIAGIATSANLSSFSTIDGQQWAAISTLSTGVHTATGIAFGAQGVALSAVTLANTANTVASGAQTTANNASTLAFSAQTTANNASTLAFSAQTTANNASTLAFIADSNAQAALTRTSFSNINVNTIYSADNNSAIEMCNDDGDDRGLVIGTNTNNVTIAAGGNIEVSSGGSGNPAAYLTLTSKVMNINVGNTYGGIGEVLTSQGSNCVWAAPAGNVGTSSDSASLSATLWAYAKQAEIDAQNGITTGLAADSNASVALTAANSAGAIVGTSGDAPSLLTTCFAYAKQAEIDAQAAFSVANNTSTLTSLNTQGISTISTSVGINTSNITTLTNQVSTILPSYLNNYDFTQSTFVGGTPLNTTNSTLLLRTTVSTFGNTVILSWANASFSNTHNQPLSTSYYLNVNGTISQVQYITLLGNSQISVSLMGTGVSTAGDRNITFFANESQAGGPDTITVRYAQVMAMTNGFRV